MADIEGIITSSLESAGVNISDDSGDSGGEVATETPAVEAVSTPETTEAPADGETPAPEAQTEEVPELSEAELAGPSLPLHRHKAVLTNARNKAAAEIAEVKAKYEALQWAEAPDVREKLQALDVAETNPEGFMQALLTDERYQRVFQKLVEQAQAKAAPQTAPAAAVPLGEAPQPDILLSDGSMTYSADAAQRLVQYQLQQAEKALTERFSKQMEERLGKVDPLVKQLEADAQRKQLESHYQRQIEQAKSWDGFTENYDAIRAWFADPKTPRNADLNDAYRAVVIPKLKAQREVIRKELLAEIAKKPAAAGSVKGPVTAAAPAGPRSVEQIIMDSTKGL